MYGALFALCRVLSPRWEAECAVRKGTIPWLRVLLALYATQAALLAAAARMLCSASVTWAGVRYARAAGRVRVAGRA